MSDGLTRTVLPCRCAKGARCVPCMEKEGTHLGDERSAFVRSGGEHDTFGEHQQRVAANFVEGSAEHCTALYHDHLEDALGDVPLDVLPHVVVLTRRPNETYKAYIAAVADSHDPVAIAVKVADLRDNLARCRGEFDGFVNSNRANRYQWALNFLEAQA